MIVYLSTDKQSTKCGFSLWEERVTIFREAQDMEQALFQGEPFLATSGSTGPTPYSEISKVFWTPPICIQLFLLLHRAQWITTERH